MFKVFFFGYGGHVHYAEVLRPLINELGMELVTIHEWDNADIRWVRTNWFQDLNKADIIICPTDPNKFPAKSQNKLTQALSMGKPVICSSLPAYIEVEKKFPGCCLFADSEDQWREQLVKLRDGLKLREDLIQKGLEAAKEYSLDKIGEKWAKVLTNIKRISVDIIIPTYKNVRGLKLCLESIRKCTHLTYRIIVVNNGALEEMNQFLKEQKDILYIKKERMTFAQAVNTGIQSGSSLYVMILNDDVIVSKNWLKIMVESCTEDVGVVGPLSNCDKGWLHNLNINIGGIDLLPGKNTFEQIEPIVNQIHSYQSPYSEIKEQSWMAFYCTLIPRSVLDKTGLLNEEFTNSGEDVDLCYRIHKMGFKIIQNLQSFVFHFGAVSRKMLEQEDSGSYQKADQQTNSHLHKLWNKKSVMIYSGPSWERWDFRNLETTGIGGSEVWHVQLSRSLSELGYRVVVFADCPEPEIMDGDVQWLHYSVYSKWVEQHWVDYAILSRTTDPLRFPLRAGKIFVQIHDVWLLSDRNQLFLDKVTKFCALSEWHMNFASDHHGIPREKMALTANGIDPKLFQDMTIEKPVSRLHWSSSWDRGLDNILYMFPHIKKAVPDLELHVFYGVYNWKESCKRKNDQEGLKKIAALEEQLKQPGIFTYGRVTQSQLSKEEAKATLWLYPSWFSETFCITAIECQAARVPVLASKYAGLITSVGDSGILLGDGSSQWPYTAAGRETFISEAINFLLNPEKRQVWIDRGLANSAKYSWHNVALMWRDLFEN